VKPRGTKVYADLGLAGAALLAVGGLVLDGGHHLGERGEVLRVLRRDGLGRGEHRGLDVSLGAGAAAEGGELLGDGGLVLARGLLADELALGARAHQRLAALPVAVRGLAEGGALRLRRDARSVADRGRADRLALRAVVLLAQRLRATDRAGRLLAVNIALGARELLALHLALRASADGVAHSRAGRVIALPLADRVATLDL